MAGKQIIEGNPDILVQEQLDLAYNNFPLKAIELANGRISLDSFLSQADYQLLACDNLDQGLQAWVRVISPVSRDALIHLLKQRGGTLLLLETPAALSSAWLHLLRAVELRLQRFVPNSGYSRALKWQWQIHSRKSWLEGRDIGLQNCTRGSQNHLLLPADLTRYFYPDPLPRVHQLLDLYVQQVLLDQGPTLNLVEQCKQILLRALPRVLKLPDLAAELDLSGRALQRRLQEDSASYSELLSQVRQVKARSRLVDSKVSVQQLASELGFAEPASFIRAFTRLEGCSPAEYRRQSQLQHAAAAHHPVRLYYAENFLQTKEAHSRRGAKVWIAIQNLAYSKEVSVACEDLDGTWRRYACSFERWISEHFELWSSCNIPVFNPFRFRIYYRVGHVLYTDDNDGHDYILSQEDAYLLGKVDVVCQHLDLIQLPDRFLLTGRILSRRQGADKLTASIRNDHTNKVERVPATAIRHNQQGVMQWHLGIEIKRKKLPANSTLRVTFQHDSAKESTIEDNEGHGFIPRFY